MANASKGTAFAYWFVFERDANRTETHGPEHFSLVFVQGEGVATYQAIFNSNKLSPAIVAIIRPGIGFGGNFGEFENALSEVMLNNSAGLQDRLLNWGVAPHDNGRLIEPWCKSYETEPSDYFRKDHEPNAKIYSPAQMTYEELTS